MEYWNNYDLNALPDEEWRPVVGFDALYEVSNLGRVKSLSRVVTVGTSARRRAHERCIRARIIRSRRNPRGYHTCVLTRDAAVTTHYVHTLVAQAFIGESNGLTVNHRDQNKSNNTVDNLEYMTRLDNYFYSIDSIKEKLRRKCYQYDADGKFVKEYDSVNDAAADNGMKAPSVVFHCKKHCKKGCRIHFRYFKADMIELPERVRRKRKISKVF